jgi:hypothetical protein
LLGGVFAQKLNLDFGRGRGLGHGFLVGRSFAKNNPNSPNKKVEYWY